MANGERGPSPSARQLALGRIAATQAVETAASVTRTANTLGGGSSIYSTSSLQRHARDAEAITHHFTVTPHTWEEAGRVLLGRKPNVPSSDPHGQTLKDLELPRFTEGFQLLLIVVT